MLHYAAFVCFWFLALQSGAEVKHEFVLCHCSNWRLQPLFYIYSLMCINNTPQHCKNYWACRQSG